MFHFNESMEELVTLIVRSVPEFQNIDTSRLLVSASFNRSRRSSGLIAYVLPLKYREGSPVETRIRGKKEYHYAMLPYQYEGREILYILYFLLPRFQNLSLRDKLETVIHELYHINPSFNGDLRRLKGRSSIHGNSLEEYDEKIRAITDRFLAMSPPLENFSFLGESYRDLEHRMGGVIAQHVREPRPTLLKVH
jgi:hypothetical protein